MIPKGISSLIANVFEWHWDHLRIRIYMKLLEKARKPHPCFWLLLGIWRSLTRKDPFPCCTFLQSFFDIWECTFKKKWIMPTYMVYLKHIHMLSPNSNLPTSCFTYLWWIHCALPWFGSKPLEAGFFFWKRCTFPSVREGGSSKYKNTCEEHSYHFGVSKMVWLHRLCPKPNFFPPKCLTDFSGFSPTWRLEDEAGIWSQWQTGRYLIWEIELKQVVS